MTSEVVRRELVAALGEAAVMTAPGLALDDLHDESLHRHAVEPLAVVRPSSTAEVASVARIAARHGVALVPRGSGTGLSGAAEPVPGGIVVCFDAMKRILRLDPADQVAVVQPGLTLRELGDALAGTGLRYPVYPGEMSGSIGGNVNTNAGGMRAVRHGVTRHHVLGLELVLADATVLRCGGAVMKSSSGYDVTQLVIGSEGTLALVTEVTLKLAPVLTSCATMLVPFENLASVCQVVPRLIATGLSPSITEYVDAPTLRALAAASSLELGVAPQVAERAAAYLIVLLETRTDGQMDADLASASALLEEAGALDVYVLGEHAASQLIEARERLFWVSRDEGVRDIIDVVVPRSAVPSLLDASREISRRYGTRIGGCGHVGDGNVHLSVFVDDDERRQSIVRELLRLGLAVGGQISGEHGIGRDKQDYYLEMTDPALLTLQGRLKDAFDPEGRMNPFRRFTPRGGDA
jgi:glycolate oxidase